MTEEPKNPIAKFLRDKFKGVVDVLAQELLVRIALLVTGATISPLLLIVGFPSVQDYFSSRKEVVLLPANKLWLDTGLQVKPGQEVKITATGSINLEIQGLVKAAHTREYPRWGWMDPSGGQSINPAKPEILTKNHLILPDRNFGVLLACVTKDDLGRTNPRPKNITVVGKDGSIKSEQGGKLWLVVNDAVLDKDDAESAYVLSQKDLDHAYGPGKVTVKQRKDEWIEIKKRGYVEAYFDDNVGEFLVQIVQ